MQGQMRQMPFGADVGELTLFFWEITGPPASSTQIVSSISICEEVLSCNVASLPSIRPVTFSGFGRLVEVITSTGISLIPRVVFREVHLTTLTCFLFDVFMLSCFMIKCQQVALCDSCHCEVWLTASQTSLSAPLPEGRVFISRLRLLIGPKPPVSH